MDDLQMLVNIMHVRSVLVINVNIFFVFVDIFVYLTMVFRILTTESVLQNLTRFLFLLA